MGEMLGRCAVKIDLGVLLFALLMCICAAVCALKGV